MKNIPLRRVAMKDTAMKHIAVKLVVLIGLSLSTFSVAVHAQDCSAADSLQPHIYRPERLEPTGKGCITVTGKILAKVPEKDGDLHYRMRLDPGQGTGLINSKNNTKNFKRFLVLEPLCIGRVTQKNAKAACRRFHQRITLPNKGDRVSVTGIHIRDAEHGWLELHPVTEITILKPKR
jgi:hypothetical protein